MGGALLRPSATVGQNIASSRPGHKRVGDSMCSESQWRMYRFWSPELLSARVLGPKAFVDQKGYGRVLQNSS